ncbi:protein yellow-like [Cloeon dipterum]|uniref:protein yellow-like n=1 Tax=Cloeon dipterum TaxID=197152 RepID=UPI0032204DF5
MSPFFAAIFLHSLCLATAINFTTVYEWETFDFDCPYGKIRQDFDPKNVYLQNMAVFERRLFLSLNLDSGIPATLVWVPTSGTSAAPPKLSPFPTWHLHEKHNCHTIQRARGMETDTGGRLWVLDNGSWECPKSKLWIFDMFDIDETERVHEFPDAVVSHTYKTRVLRNIVLDKTPDDNLAYITESESEHLVVYSRKMDKSWTVKTPGRKWYSLALSPDMEATKQLYLARAFSYELYSVSVSELKNEGGTAAVKLIGEWTGVPYRMLIDSANVLYAAFFDKNYLSKWNISEPFHEQRFHEVGRLGAFYPFIIALDTTNTLWMTERNQSGGANETRNKLLKADVDVRSYSFSVSTGSTTPQVNVTSEVVKSAQDPTIGGHAGLVADHRKSQFSNTIMILLLVCFLVLSSTVIVWLTLRMRRMQTSFRQIPFENNGEMFVFLDSKHGD